MSGDLNNLLLDLNNLSTINSIIKMRSSQSDKYGCGMCDEEFVKIDDARAHLKVAHLRHLICPYCDKLFPNVVELNTHKELHIRVALSNAPDQNGDIFEAPNGQGKGADGKHPLSSSRENAKAGPHVYHFIGMSNHPFSFNASDSQPARGNVEKANELKASHYQVFQSSCMPLKLNLSQKNVAAGHPSQLRGVSTNDCTAMKDNENGEENIASINIKHENKVLSYTQKPKDYSCNVCKNKYYSMKEVQSHVKETHVNMLTCLLCQERFQTRSQYMSHSLSHLNGTWAPPGEEGSQKRNTGEASPEGIGKNEQSVSRKLNEFGCRLCNGGFASLEVVRAHVKKVHLDGLACLLCNQKFPDQYTMICHAQEYHDTAIRKDLPMIDDASQNCPNSPPKCGSEQNVAPVDRVKTDYNDGSISAANGCESNTVGQRPKEEVQCDQCGLYFISSSSLMVHQKMHKKAIYKCGVCGFSSMSREYVISHLNESRHSFQMDLNEEF